MASFSRITVGQINLRKSKLAAAELGCRTFDLAVVQEPYSCKGRIACVGGYSRILYNAVRGTVARTCICTNLNCWRVDEFTCEDLTTVVMPSMSGKILYVASLYLDIELPVENPIFKKLVERCADEQIPLIVGADTNAHGSMWGCVDTNKRGEDLEIFLLQH